MVKKQRGFINHSNPSIRNKLIPRLRGRLEKFLDENFRGKIFLEYEPIIFPANAVNWIESFPGLYS